MLINIRYILIIAFIAIASLHYTSTSVYAAALQRNVYLQNATSTSMDVVWKTDTGGDSVVKYGNSASYGQQVTGEVGKKTIDGAVGFIHHAKITGLSADTLYYYQILTAGTALSPAGDQTYAFKTPPSGASPFSFAIWGDSGNGSSNQKAVAAQVVAKKPNFVVVAGDIDYGGNGYGSDVSVTTEGTQDTMYFDMYKDTMKSAVFYPVCGNHDGNTISTPNGSLNGCQIVDGDHYLPGGGKMGGINTTYSTDWGNVHLTVINSNDNVTFNSANPSASAPQMAWAYNDIKNSSQPWKIFVFHHNAWSNGSHSTLTDIRDNVAVMAQQAGAHVLLWGHSHVYERFSRYSKSQGIGKGPYYFTIGNGGQSGGVSACGTYSGGPTCLAASGQGSIPSGSGFLYVQVNNDKMIFNYIGSNGTQYDTVTYTLSEFGPVPTSVTTPTPTPTVAANITPTIPSGGQCPLKGEGDANCDSKIDFVDLEILRKEMNGILTTLSADFNKDGVLNVVDVEIFRKGLYKSLGITPSVSPTGTPAILPAPSNLQASCGAPGTQATLRWDAVAGANAYWLIIDDMTNTWSDFCAAHLGGDICTTSQTNSYSFSTTPGHPFRWGIQAYNGLYGNFLLGPEFTCASGGVSPTTTPAITNTPSPTIITPTGGPTVTQGPTVTVVPPGSGLWLSPAEISALPASGTAWNDMKAVVDGAFDAAELYNQDSHHPEQVLAVALVYAKTGTASYATKVKSELMKITAYTGPKIGGSEDGRSLALGRNLASYVIAADLINLSKLDAASDQKFRTFLTNVRKWPNSEGRSLIECHEIRPNNWGTMCGASRIAADIYLKDSDLVSASQVFKGYLGDKAAYSGFTYDDPTVYTWTCTNSQPPPINPVGCTKSGHDLSGAPVDDVRRGGGFTWPPTDTNYAWGGFSAAVAQAELLKRAGYDSYNWESQAVLRGMEFISKNMPNSASYPTDWVAFIINKRYNTSYTTVSSRTGYGRLLDWTAWTHSR